jgi:hypothetical protein
MYNDVAQLVKPFVRNTIDHFAAAAARAETVIATGQPTPGDAWYVARQLGDGASALHPTSATVTKEVENWGQGTNSFRASTRQRGVAADQSKLAPKITKLGQQVIARMEDAVSFTKAPNLEFFEQSLKDAERGSKLALKLQAISERHY